MGYEFLLCVCVVVLPCEKFQAKRSIVPIHREWCSRCGFHKKVHGLPDGIHNRVLVITSPVNGTAADAKRIHWLLENL